MLGERQLPCSIRRPANPRLLSIVASASLVVAAPATAQSGGTRALKLHNADANCAAYVLQPRTEGRTRLMVTSRCDKVTVLVCAFRPAPGPAAWDCQQPAFSSANQRRAMPYDLPA